MEVLPFRFAVLTIAATVALHGGCAPSSDTDSMLYDPEPYKEIIQKIEALVNKAEAGPTDGAALYKHAIELAGALGKNIDNHTFREIVQNRLMSFGEYFTAQEDRGLTIDLVEARDMWKKVRKDLFRPADWFQ